MWVPKNKITYVADILSNKFETPVKVLGLWVLSTHDRKKTYISRARTKPRGSLFGGIHKGKIIGTRTIGNNSLPSTTNVLLVECLMHNLIPISQLSDSFYDIIFNHKSCKVVSQKDGSVVFSGKRKNNIYQIKIFDLEKQNVKCLMPVNKEQLT